MVSAYADTLLIDSARLNASRARIEVSLHNYLPVSEITIPFRWSGSFDLRFDSLSITGLRTETFPRVQILSLNTSTKEATVRLGAGNGPNLSPGEGPVLAIHFTSLSGNEPGASPIGFVADGAYPPELVTYAGAYLPATVDGAVYYNCCIGRVGDVNGIDGDEPTLSDIMVLVWAKFIYGRCDQFIDCLAEGDVNQSGGANPDCDDITLVDIMILVDYLFITGPSAGLPDCF
jgi:hypothetical protein